MDKNHYSEIGKKGAATNKEKSIKKYYENPAICKYCRKIIELRDGETPSITKQRAFCSSECRSKFQSQRMIGNRIKEHKIAYCVNCGQELKRHQNKFCGSQCQKDFEYKEYIDKWKNGLVNGMRGEYQLSSYIQRYIKEKYDNKCCECGWDKINPFTKHSPLEVHHIDGDYTNNLEDNLTLLCPNCHSLTNTYKNASCHEGRQGRNKYYKNKRKL